MLSNAEYLLNPWGPLGLKSISSHVTNPFPVGYICSTMPGHVICRGCKTEAKLTSCKICKQTFVDAPNIVLEKLISMIALPCRFRATGCTDFVFSDKKLEHETFCPYRPINCQYAINGCCEELPYKDISQHHHKCSYNPRSPVPAAFKE